MEEARREACVTASTGGEEEEAGLEGPQVAAAKVHGAERDHRETKAQMSAWRAGGMGGDRNKSQTCMPQRVVLGGRARRS
jgi:hypothetical protein